MGTISSQDMMLYPTPNTREQRLENEIADLKELVSRYEERIAELERSTVRLAEENDRIHDSMARYADEIASAEARIARLRAVLVDELSHS